VIAFHPDAEHRREPGYHHARERDDEPNIQITAEKAADGFPHLFVLQVDGRNAAITLWRSPAPVNDDRAEQTLQAPPEISPH
jgi:hypothetical protein